MSRPRSSFLSTAICVTTSVLGCDPGFLTAQYFFRSRPPFFFCFLPSHVLNLSCDLNTWLRPLLIFLAFLLVATSILSCNRFLHYTFYFRSRPKDGVATSWLLYFWLHWSQLLKRSRDLVFYFSVFLQVAT